MKYLIIVILLIALVLTNIGCSNTQIKPEAELEVEEENPTEAEAEITETEPSDNNTTNEPITNELVKPDTTATYSNFYDGSWLNLKHTSGNMAGEYYFMPETWGIFGTLAINNYYAGFDTAQLGQNYDTLFIVNRITKVSETKICITDPEETAAEIPIRRVLHDNDVSTVTIKSFEVEKVDTNWIPSNISTGEELTATDYYPNKSSIWVEGFKPDYPRAMITTYMPDTDFTVECVFIDNERNGYAAAPKEIVEWVTFDKDLYTVEPDTYMPIWVYLNVPENIKLPDKWEFWVEVSMDSGKIGSGVTGVITVRIPVQVNMAQ